MPSDLANHLFELFSKKIKSWQEPDIYAISLYTSIEEDDPRYVAVTLGFNTESRVKRQRNKASDQDEARFNYAFWLQNKEVYFPQKNEVELRKQWLDSTGFNYTDQEEDDDLDHILELGDQIMFEFNEMLIEVAQKLHESKVIKNKFHQPTPIYIHELEYHDQIAEQTRRANPEGLADDFCKWVEYIDW